MSSSLKTILKYAGYSAWFCVCLIALIYFTFPIDRFKGQVENEMEKMLGRGAQGKYGVDPEVSIDTLSMSGFPGIKASRVQIQLGSRDPDPGAKFLLDEVKAVGAVFSSLLGKPAGSFNVKAYTGTIDGALTMAKPVPAKGGKVSKKAAFALRTLDVDIEDLDISRIEAVVQKARVPVTGKIQGKVEIDMGAQPDKDAEGVVDLKIAGVNLGPGNLEIPVPGLTGGFEVPNINLGDVVAKIDIEKGKGKTEKVGITGKDIQADIEADITINRLLKMSRLKGQGWFKISEEFLKTNGKFQAILDFAAPLKKVKNEEGQYEFSINGMLKSPSFKLAKRRASKR